MRNDGYGRLVVLSGIVLVLCSVRAGGQGAGAEGVRPRYVNALYGFSLQPPAGMNPIRDFSATRVANWVRRDAKTGAIALTLTVQHVIEGDSAIDLKPYSEALAKKLRQEQGYKIDSVRVAPAAGRPAIHLRGETGAIRMWQRQAWVVAPHPAVKRPADRAPASRPAGPTRFIVLVMTGPIGAKDSIRETFDRVIGTLELFDPKEAQARRRENLERGEKLLKELDAKRLAAAIEPQPQWFLWRHKDKDVGFMRVDESVVKRAGLSGLEITSWIMLRLPGREVQMAKRVAFATPYRTGRAGKADFGPLLEQWREQLQVGSGRTSRIVAESGMLTNGEKITCDIVRDKKSMAWEKVLPASVRSIYLSRTAGMLLPRLVDLKKPDTAYAFAIYNSQANGFDMRTFCVIGPEKITLVGRVVDAIHTTDQLAADAGVTDVWVDVRGAYLRMRTPEGLAMEISTKEAVRRAFPNAEALIKATGKWAN